MSDFSDEEVSRRVSKARTFLLLDHPFFATLLLHMQPIRRDQDFDTMATDGNYLYYNGDFVMGLDMDELVGVLAHEAMHPAMAHHLRRMEREPRRWNVAADYAINPIIIDSGLKLPKNALINPKYKGMMAEEIYNLLPEQPKNAKSDPGGCGEPVDGRLRAHRARLDLPRPADPEVGQRAVPRADRTQRGDWVADLVRGDPRHHDPPVADAQGPGPGRRLHLSGAGTGTAPRAPRNSVRWWGNSAVRHCRWHLASGVGTRRIGRS